MKAILKNLLPRLSISLIAIGFIVYFMRDKLDDSARIFKTQVHWSWIFAAFIAYLLIQAVIALRLFTILRVQKILLGYWETLYLCVVGLFFNLFLPSAVGGDLAKLYYVYKYSGKKIEATSSVILDRMMGFVALISIAILAVTFMKIDLGDSHIKAVVYAFLFLMIFSTLFFASKRFARLFRFLVHLIPSRKLRGRLSDLYHMIQSFRDRKTILFVCLFLSLIGQCTIILICYFLAVSLGVEIGPGIFFVLVPVVSIVSMIPSLGGLGVREAGFIYFFSQHMNSERALALSLLMFILIYGIGLISGVVYAIRGGLKSQAIDIEEMEALDRSRYEKDLSGART